jgi:hypothetical protein
MKLNIDSRRRAILPRAAGVAMLLLGCVPLYSLGQAPGQKTFSSPEEASNALVTAVQGNDEKAMLEVLGSHGRQLIYSGDEAEDAHSRANFAEKYREMHRLVDEPDGTTTLYIGARNWPTPIPLVRKGGAWYFDTDAGRQEILFRRIGRNELSTIRVCAELVAAENEFRDAQHGEYAQKIQSDAGRQNGLYWQASAGAPQSPIGPLLAAAVAEGYANGGKNALTPFRGYYFRVLTRQGEHAPGGAKSYLVNGRMTQGFAFVAYPAVYRTSGVMTFIVGSDGTVYQKDLGKGTRRVAEAMKEYDPDATWHKAMEDQEETAGQ